MTTSLEWAERLGMSEPDEVRIFVRPPNNRPEVWKLMSQHFEGAKTYTLNIGGVQVSLDVSDDGTFEISPTEARKVPLHAIAKRIK